MTSYPSADDPRIEAEVAVNKAFTSGTVFSAAPEQLQHYLESLAYEDVPNPNVQHRQIIRALVINHLQMKQFITKLDRRNFWITIAVVLIALATFVASGIQAYAAVKTLQYSASARPTN